MNGHEIKAFRDGLCLSQSEFAKLVGVSGDRTVRKWENEESEVPGSVVRLLEAFQHFRPVMVWALEREDLI